MHTSVHQFKGKASIYKCTCCSCYEVASWRGSKYKANSNSSRNPAEPLFFWWAGQGLASLLNVSPAKGLCKLAPRFKMWPQHFPTGTITRGNRSLACYLHQAVLMGLGSLTCGWTTLISLDEATLQGITTHIDNKMAIALWKKDMII